MEAGVARVDALGREGQEEVLPHDQAALREHGQDQLLGGPRVGRAFQHYQLPGAETGRDRPGRIHHHRQVGVLGLAEGRGHADDEGVRAGELLELTARPQPPRRHQLLHPGRGDVLDVRLPPVHPVHLVRREVEAGDLEPRGGELHRQGKPDVAQTQGRHLRIAAAQTLLQLFRDACHTPRHALVRHRPRLGSAWRR